MELEKYSMGIGDRFGYECTAQLRALRKASESGVRIVPVWNKSNREHAIAGTLPEAARKAADKAVRECGWLDSVYVDADHIGLSTVDAFMASHNFFTIDIADFIGEPAPGSAKSSFLGAMARYKGTHAIAGIEQPMQVTDAVLDKFADEYAGAISEAGNVYRHIAERKAEFVTEVSIDEARNPQTPVELLLILAGMACEKTPLQTIAPKYTGSFLKGVDYVGDPARFSREFDSGLAVIAYAVENFGLPRNLKLSIHTGSDKFTLYPIVRRAIQRVDAGIHLKTAGTTWLEEATGLAASGGAALDFVKEIYRESFQRCDELCKPYLAVVNIDQKQLPDSARVDSWSSEEFVRTLEHESSRESYNPHLRQLLHVGFRVAAEKKTRFVELLGEFRGAIEEKVTFNLYERHIRPLYLGK